MNLKLKIREELNVGTVPTFKMHNIGTVPTSKIHNVGTVPTFKMYNVGTVPCPCIKNAQHRDPNVFYIFSKFEFGL